MIHASLKIYIMIYQLYKQYETIIMARDNNTDLNTSMDHKGNPTTNYHLHAHKEITNVMEILELVDIWRLKCPDLVIYTWRRLNEASRLDYILMSFSLAPNV